jgi:uncharacterized protein (DUF2235 family)
MPKNIVVLADGTGQLGGETENTNVYNIFNMVEDRTPRQVVFYEPGIGTGSEKIVTQATGFGISEKIMHCYQFIFENYQAGDRIYLIGFSRGSTTIRSLSNFIHHFGILPESRPDLIQQAYGLYQEEDEEKLKEQAKELISKNHTMWVRIHFIGCFDTVAALGLPGAIWKRILNFFPFFRYEYQELALPDSVIHAVHALAIDENRKVFHPTLWQSKIKDYQTLIQVWFCGCHSDVGGGYKDHHLADIPLVWMLQNAVKRGLLIYPGNQVRPKEDANGFLHDPLKDTWWAKIVFQVQARTWDTTRSDRPIIHESVLKRFKNPQNGTEPEYSPWIMKFKPAVEPWAKLEKQTWYRAMKKDRSKK